jgi:uncharacterized repeat protein (TIGR03803 family)
MKKLFALLFIFHTSVFVLPAQCTLLHSFNDTLGMYPSGTLTLYKNKIYGTTSQGGNSNLGVIFSMDTNGANYKILHFFFLSNGASGGYGSLTPSGKNLYGMTPGGGTVAGVIFCMDTNGNNYRVLFNFNAASGDGPGGSLLLSGKKFYGMTYTGGYHNKGVIFSVDTNGSNYKPLLKFNDTNGANPYGDLTISDKKLYGMTRGGGDSLAGVIFSIDTSGNNYHLLYNFNYATGSRPLGSLILSGNTLFGTTCYGGANNYGVIFSIDTNGNNYWDMFDFDTASGIYPSYCKLALYHNNTLCGLTNLGGMYNYGTIFSINTNGLNFQKLMDFSGSNGAIPYASVTLSGDRLYGTAGGGGLFNRGVVFSLEVNDLGVSDANEKGANVSLYPNPSSGVFTIKISEFRTKNSIEIYNMLGENVYASSLNSSTTPIDMSNNPSGIYLYRVIAETGGLLSEGKFVIQK